MLGFEQLPDRLYYSSLVRLGRQMIRRDGADENLMPCYRFYSLCMKMIMKKINKEVEDYLTSGHDVFSTNIEDSQETLFSMGLAYERGYMLGPDPEEAIKCYQAAADMGNATALYRIGFVCEQNPDLVTKLGSPASYYSQAAKKDVPEAWIALGQFELFSVLQSQSQNTKETSLDPTHYIKPFLQAERLGWMGYKNYLWYLEFHASDYLIDDRYGINISDLERHFCYDLQVTYSEMRDKLYWFNYADEITLRLARFLAIQDNVNASIFISWCYLNGRILPKRFDMALRWALDAAKNKDAEAIHYLSWVCLHGTDERYAEKALEYLSEASNLSHIKSKSDILILSALGLDKPHQLWLRRNNLPKMLAWYTDYALVDDFSRFKTNHLSDVN